MKQLFLMVNNGSIKLIDTPRPTVKESSVVVETLYSVVSAGTERSLASFGEKNLIQKALERPDQVKKVTEKIATEGFVTTVESALTRLAEPMPMGYSGVGRVIECGENVTEVNSGDMVVMVGQAYHSEVNRVNKNLIAKIPEPIDDYRQFALSALGGIALEGIHQAEVCPGETVAVIGLGLLGHITARILDAYGCDVIGFDIADKKLERTKLKGFIKSDDDNATDITKGMTKGRGVDKVIITAAANSNMPMDLAASITRDRGTVCMIGVTQMNIDRRLYYEKELTFKIARSYGAGRYDPVYEEKGIDYPIGYVRFTEGRNIEEFVRLIVEERCNFTDLITHEVPFEQAEKAYEMITTNKKQEKYIGVLLKYTANQQKWKNTILFPEKNIKIQDHLIPIGLIGAGNFSRNTLLPAMKNLNLYHFYGLATTGGASAAQTQEVFQFSLMTNDYKQLLEAEKIKLVVVSTQHNSHAKFIVEALKAGKNVYCEKPLCLTLEELDLIEKTYREEPGELFCGLNRRYAPMIEEIKNKMFTDQIPAVYNYIVNAGYIPENHWTQDEKTGGGRLLGESCHFIDVLQYLDGSPITSLKLTVADHEGYNKKDNAFIILQFASGAIGNIIYTSMGSKKYPKEQLKVFSNGMVMELDNYIRLISYGNKKQAETKLKQNKGFVNQYQYIYNVLKGREKNTSIEDTFVGHRKLIEQIKLVKEQYNARKGV